MGLKKVGMSWCRRFATACAVGLLAVPPICAQSEGATADPGHLQEALEAPALDAFLVQSDLGVVSWTSRNRDATRFTLSVQIEDDGWYLNAWAISMDVLQERVLLDKATVVPGKPTTVYIPPQREGIVVQVELGRTDDSVPPHSIASWEMRAPDPTDDVQEPGNQDVIPGGSVTNYTCNDSQCKLTILYIEPKPAGVKENPEVLDMKNGDVITVNNSLVVRVICSCG